RRATAARRAAPPPSDSARVVQAVWTLADPRWEGRGVGTAGLEQAASWIAYQMRDAGLAPAFGGDWRQSFEVTTGVRVGEPSGIDIGGEHWDEGDDFEPLGFSANGTLTAQVVFAGYGITAAEYHYDDYANLDVRDKIVLVLRNEPNEMDSTSIFDGDVNTPYSDPRTKAINAREHGALGLLLVNGPRYHIGEPLQRPRPDGSGYMSSGLVAAQISEQVAQKLLGRASLAQYQMAIDHDTRPHNGPLPDSARIEVTLERTRADIANVAGTIPGRDTSRAIVVGAHYDHLGWGNESSLAPGVHAIHPGADDNASGVAALLGTARALARRAASGQPPEHTLVFCAFTGEEMGLVGSSHFVDDPPLPLERVETMVNADMVGRLRNDKLVVMGAGTASEFKTLLKDVNGAGFGFDLKTSDDGYGPSDHSSFYKRNLPVLMLFTGAHADYHKPSDTPDKINDAGLWKVTRFETALVESLDARPKPRFEHAQSDSSYMRLSRGGSGYGAYLGTIPDYTQTEGGVLLSGVREGSPADRAGIKGGDVIVKFDGVKIDNIYDYTFALRARKPGQQVRVTVKRGGALVDLTPTLGRRPT
ncbi:MAG TPA: M28 family peptidase, partial [Candidatus Eisenbacteria bacterium]|nr:M28 family peptidase [Candidatus Eisenbacteria bacterium]